MLPRLRRKFKVLQRDKPFDFLHYPGPVFDGSKVSLTDMIDKKRLDDKVKEGAKSEVAAVYFFVPGILNQVLVGDYAIEIGAVYLSDGPGEYEIPFKAPFLGPPLMLKHTFGWFKYEGFFGILNFRFPLFGFITEIYTHSFKHLHIFGQWRLVTYVAFGAAERLSIGGE